MLDLRLNPQPHRFCNGWARRDFLRVGALAPLGLALPSLLAAEKAAGTDKKARAKSVVLVFLGGGLSHHDSFDLKPDASSEIRGKYTEIPTNVPGLHVGELLPKMAKTMDKLTLVRSGAHNNDHHETATNWVLSGRFGSAFGDYPAMGAVVAERAGFRSVMPPYVAVPRNPSFTWELGKSAFLGGRCESFKAGDPNAENFKVRDLSLPTDVKRENVERRKSLLATVDNLAKRVEGNDQLATYGEFQQRAAEMVLSREAQNAFDIEQESAKLRDDYGRSTFGQSVLLARRLVQHGVRFVTVNYGGWDHHAKIFQGLEKKLPEFDQGFSTFIHDMDAHGLLKDTLVVCMGEFGRTPKINKDAGRDHWGPAASLLFAGAGVARGKVIGATDRTGAFVTDTPVKPADVAWTIYDSLGLDPRGEVHTPDGRPVGILDEGRLVTELFG
ncbi:MAG: DUF1501 domain-containing protein [Limisphaerales bacterium]